MRKLLVIVAVLFLLLGIAAFAQSPPAPTRPESAPPAAQPVASPEYLSRYDQLVGLLKTLEDIDRETGFRAIARRAQQLQSLLLAETPKGYALNEKTRSFEKLPEPATAPPPAKAEAKKP